MRRLATLLRRWADALDPPVITPVTYAPDPYRDLTRALIAEAEGRFGAGFGDAKRRDVYAALMKRFPDARKRDLAYAIERVLQERAGVA